MEPAQLDIFGQTEQDQPPLGIDDNSVKKGTGDPIMHTRDPTDDTVNQHGENLSGGLSASQAAAAYRLREKSIRLKFKNTPPPAPEPEP